MSDYDKIEKIFTGSWKYDREENMAAFMEAMGKSNIQYSNSGRVILPFSSNVYYYKINT